MSRSVLYVQTGTPSHISESIYILKVLFGAYGADGINGQLGVVSGGKPKNSRSNLTLPLSERLSPTTNRCEYAAWLCAPKITSEANTSLKKYRFTELPLRYNSGADHILSGALKARVTSVTISP